MNNYVVVVGAINIDIIARSSVAIVSGDSNPGHITISLGGVGRNIAENLARLNLPIKLISVIGDDAHQALIKQVHQAVGIDMSSTLELTNTNNSTYLAIVDHDGEMQLAVNDMGIIDQLTPTYLETQLAVINQAKAVVVDTNLSQAAIDWLMEHISVPIFVDPVSTHKAMKLKPHLNKIYGIKPNRLEAGVLSDMTEKEDLLRGLLDQGIQEVYLSMGSQGLWLGDHSQQQLLPLPTAHVVDTTGCGDALMAGLIYGWYHGYDLIERGYWGLAMAYLTAQVPQATNPNITIDQLTTTKEHIKCHTINI